MVSDIAKKYSRLDTLVRRVFEYYAFLSAGDGRGCFRFVDPVIRKSISRAQYIDSIAAFNKQHGSVRIRTITIIPKTAEPNVLYANREFAIVELLWEDKNGDQFPHRGPWVRNNAIWYTRCVGYAPTTVSAPFMPTVGE